MCKVQEQGKAMNSQLLLSIEKDLEDLPTASCSPVSVSPFIYRVPKELREGNESHYTPSTISIGPLHAGTGSLQPAEQLKKHFLKSLLSGISPALEGLLHSLKEAEDRARRCYAEPIRLGSDEFVKMMLLDGCFILELMWRLESDQILDRSDPAFAGRATAPLLHNLKQDLLLLENQIPLFVLQILANAIRPSENNGQLIKRALIFFGSLFPVGKTKLCSVDYGRDPRHLLELVLFTLFPARQTVGSAPQTVGSTPKSWNYARGASELELFGIDLKTTLNHCLSDVKFSNGALTIPTLVIHESTASLFKNLLALEQCSDHGLSCFVSYLVLMDTLINTEADVERLLRARVLDTWCNDKQALMSLFNNLTANVAFYKEEFPLGYVFDELNEYCSSRLVRWPAYFMRYYYESRWDILILILLFILTVTQTLFSILSYNPHKKN